LTSPVPPFRRRRDRLVLAAASAVYLAALASVTLGPQPEGVGGTLATWAAWFSTWLPVVTYSVLEFTANIALFVPAGVLGVLWLGRRRWWLAVPVGLALTCAIEAVQALALPDRYPDVRDLVSNTLGALIGAAATVVALRALLRPHRPRPAATRAA
jgi:glycopeptide antibiotics resistance protein